MAIYHLHIKILSRSQGKSAVAAAAYRRATQLYDERAQQTWDYSSKQDVIHHEILVPYNAPMWAKDIVDLHERDQDSAAERLWNFVESFEKRMDSQLSREMEFSLPIELTETQCIDLARDFIQCEVVSKGMIADWNVHWEEGNPHVHVMLTTRRLTPEGFGEKVVDWNRKELLFTWREKWAEYANYHLKLHQHNVRIDHRSYRDQGIDLLPTVHRGWAAEKLEAKGFETVIFEQTREINRQNLTKIASDPNVLLRKVTAEQEVFTENKLYYELSRYGDVPQSSTPDPYQLKPEIVEHILDNLLQHHSVISEVQLASALAKFVVNPKLFTLALTKLKNAPQLIPLGLGEDGRERFTTQQFLTIENEIQTLADQLKNRYHLKMSPSRLASLISLYESQVKKHLTNEQQAALRYILESQRLRCLVGRAGTGKSFLLGAARAIWEGQGLNVQGIALSGIAADGLAQEAGITSRTIRSFLFALKEEKIKLTSHDIVVMDEAGMTDSSAMRDVLKAVDVAKAKIVLVGDAAQLQPVGPGATFRAVVERAGFKEIQAVYRQQIDWQREATTAFAAGDTLKGLGAYEAHDCIHLEKNFRRALSVLVTDWMKTVDESQQMSQVLAIAHRNKDVTLLNRLIRKALIQAGKLTPGYSVIAKSGSIQLAKGDRLLFLKNDQKLGVRNGRFATVEFVNVSEGGQVLSITVKLDGNKSRQVTFDPQHYREFTYGYAATIYKTQGISINHALVFGNGYYWNRQLTYVAMSRHRQSCHLYAPQNSHKNTPEFKQHLSRLALKDSVLDFPWAFAERRGIENGHLSSLLLQRLKTRLHGLYDSLYERYQATFFPEQYWQRKAQFRAEQKNWRVTRQRRQEAALVAQYVDSQKEVGKAWQAFNTKREALGIAITQRALLKNTPEYQLLLQKTHERDRLATLLYQSPDCYKVAIDHYGLSLARFSKEAQAFEKRERVLAYIEENGKGQVVLRDRLAAIMVSDIKGYYPALKENEVDIKILQRQATQHQRRYLLATLTLQARNAFYKVEHYRTLTQTVAKSYQQINRISKNAKETINDYLEQLATQVKARDQLAHEIYTDITQFSVGLDFYQIGIAQPTAGFDKPSPLAIQSAQARWYRLQQQAAQHERRTRLTTLEEALSREEKKLLRLALRYQRVNRQVGKKWASLAIKKEKQPLLFKMQQLKAFQLTAKRDYLAARLRDYHQELQFTVWLEENKSLEALEALLQEKRFSWEKIQQQADKYEKRVDAVKNWFAVQTQANEALEGLMAALSSGKPLSQDAYLNWLIFEKDAQQLLKPIQAQWASNTYALQAIHYSPTALKKMLEASQQLRQALTRWHTLTTSQTPEKEKLSEEQLLKIKRAERIAQGTRPIKNTLAERYLREHRGIQGEIPASFRYHPSVYHFEVKRTLPALVVLAQNAENRVQAVQVIYLDAQTANKAKLNSPKLTFGVLSAGRIGVRVNTGRNHRRIAVAEGPETALSIREAAPELTVYAVLGSSNFARAPVKKETETVLFCADNDGQDSPTEKKLLKAASLLAERGVNVQQVMPDTVKQDFNDVLLTQGKAAVKAYLENPHLLATALTPQVLRQASLQAADAVLQAADTPTSPIEEKALFEVASLDQICEQLVNQEVELQRLLAGKLENLMEFPEISQKFNQQAITLQAQIKEFAAEALKQPSIKAETEKVRQERKITIAACGGFAAIQTRLKQNTLTAEDQIALLKHLTSKAWAYTRDLQQSQERDRGGRGRSR